ncbi:hypothetical protein SAMN05192558_101270 [Actinokineospora alba]|uniref:Uncharacterized protein n=1 Tax=Actinokineospora alba TaxID=504798 RepID=A0A1H0F8J9_9PSEU|nr:hypothetical protein [Actinokineospora alba]TDP69380.1 hypothetical protein C8E96_4966 [Actinokineospora alba]SDI17917.1 hypothetical protein SAMN05421871_103600 [Actinokineospora alba]SDN90832.1 hypothetical protein SAMN05192558_101270 [Actinokineospora alba]
MEASSAGSDEQQVRELLTNVNSLLAQRWQRHENWSWQTLVDDLHRQDTWIASDTSCKSLLAALNNPPDLATFMNRARAAVEQVVNGRTAGTSTISAESRRTVEKLAAFWDSCPEKSWNELIGYAYIKKIIVLDATDKAVIARLGQNWPRCAQDLRAATDRSVVPGDENVPASPEQPRRHRAASGISPLSTPLVPSAIDEPRSQAQGRRLGDEELWYQLRRATSEKLRHTYPLAVVKKAIAAGSKPGFEHWNLRRSLGPPVDAWGELFGLFLDERFPALRGHYDDLCARTRTQTESDIYASASYKALDQIYLREFRHTVETIVSTSKNYLGSGS